MCLPISQHAAPPLACTPTFTLAHPPLPTHHPKHRAARAQRQSLTAQRERSALTDDMARLGVEAGAVARAVRAAAKEREGRLVEVDLWKLEVQRLRAALGRWASREDGRRGFG